jgi:hypothetical protein
MLHVNVPHEKEKPQPLAKLAGLLGASAGKIFSERDAIKAEEIDLFRNIARKLAANSALDKTESADLLDLLNRRVFTEDDLARAVEDILKFERALQICVSHVISANKSNSHSAGDIARLKELETEISVIRGRLQSGGFMALAAGSSIGALRDIAIGSPLVFGDVDVQALVARHVASETERKGSKTPGGESTPRGG